MAEKIHPVSRKMGAVYGAICIILYSLHMCPGSRLTRRETKLWNGWGGGGNWSWERVKGEWAGKGVWLSLWLWGSVRNGGKRSPMGNESPLFNSINVSLSNERRRNVVIGWPGDWQKPSAGFQDMLQICCYNVPPARGCVDPFVRIFRIISGLFPQLGIISVTKVR